MNPQKKVSTILLLAAGMGKRLSPITNNKPKCLVEVNGASILERLMCSLHRYDFKRLIVVTGYMDHCIKEFLCSRSGSMEIEYIHNPFYETTNNIYSLWMAANLVNEPFLLMESDLVFDPASLKKMLYPDRIAIAGIQPWMNGSTVTMDGFNNVNAFHDNVLDHVEMMKYKTVNTYSFSLSSWGKIKKQLDMDISEGKKNQYYETVFKTMVAAQNLCLQAVSFDHNPWYEIDTLTDLAEAEKIFIQHPSKERYDMGFTTQELFGVPNE